MVLYFIKSFVFFFYLQFIYIIMCISNHSSHQPFYYSHMLTVYSIVYSIVYSRGVSKQLRQNGVTYTPPVLGLYAQVL